MMSGTGYLWSDLRLNKDLLLVGMVMIDPVVEFIQVKHIDSFQTLRLLIYLQERPDQEASSQEFAERLHLGDTVLLDGIVRDLQRVGLLVRIDRCWKPRSLA